MQLLSVSDLKKVFPQKKLTAVNSVSFEIYSGECFGLIGESGSGKSTVANMVAGLLDRTAGEITFDGQALPPRSCRRGFALRSQMQMIFQNPVSSFSPRMTVLNSICEGLKYRTALSRGEREEQAMRTMELVGLQKSYANRFCRELSGGECQRAAIARAIINKPRLLICDEATSALDVSVQAVIVELLQDLKEKLGLSLLFITHDIALMSNIGDRIAVMQNGLIVESGAPEQVIGAPENAYTQKLIGAAMAS